MQFFLVHEDSARALRSREERAYSLRLALAAANHSLFSSMFPEFIPPKEEEVKPSDDLSDTRGKWTFSAPASASDVESIMAMMGASGSTPVPDGRWV